MSYQIPTTDELAAQFLAALEARLNQTTPLVSKAFNRVLSVALGLFGTGLYKYASDRLLQILALTATGAGLDKIGSEYGVTRLAAVAAVLNIDLTGVNGTNIPLGTQWTSTSTGEIYTSLSTVIIAAGVAAVDGVASTPGETGNLAPGEELTINTPIAGLDTIATVASTTTTGTDRETDTAYRRRVLTRIRAAGGGGNAADYREWSEAVAGVRRAFPYSGKPTKSVLGVIGPLTVVVAPANTVEWPGHDWVDEGGAVVGDLVTFAGFVAGGGANNGTFTILSINAALDIITVSGPMVNEVLVADATLESSPGDRTTYIESTDTGVDGIPTPAELAAVRAAILVDPDTGLSRDTLGLTDERLYVEPITRLEVDVRINGIEIDAAILVATKAQLLIAITDHLYNRIVCFVDGLDYPGDRMDAVTEATLSGVVTGVLKAAGGYCDDIQIRFVKDASTTYQMDRGELAELHALTYDAW